MSWDEAAATWDEDPHVVAYAEEAFGSLRAVLHDHRVTLRKARVLDFGCGTGLLSTRLADAGAEVVALDPSAEMIDRLVRKDHPRVQPVVGELGDVTSTEPFRSPFDSIVASSVCAFVDDYPAVARQLAEHLAPGGLFVQWDWERDPNAEEDFGLDRPTIGGALVGAGLECITVNTAFTVKVEDQTMAPLRAVGRRPASVGSDLTALINGRRGGLARALGMRFTRVNLDLVEAEVKVRDHLMQPYGMVHGGVFAAFAESLCSVGAGVNVVSSGRLVVGLDNHTSFLAAVREGKMYGRATPVHRGSRSQEWTAQIFDDAGRLAARSLVRLMVLDPGSALAGETVNITT